MQGLEEERVETERKRKERQEKLDERKKQLDERRKDIQARRGKRKADDFLDELGLELESHPRSTKTDVTEKIDAAMEREDGEEE